MAGSLFVSFGIVFSFFMGLPAFSAMPTNPVIDPDFMILPDGRDLRNVVVSGTKLSLAKGSGQPFGTSTRAAYERLKYKSQTVTNYPVQWVLMDLDRNQVIDRSASSHLKIFGASVAKIYVASTLLAKQNGHLSNTQFQLMANMLVVSSNSAWTNLQKQIGNGVDDQGRARIHSFTQSAGYPRTRGFQGWWGDMHGNELVAAEIADFLYDMYMGRFAGAEVEWKLMHTCRTGSTRALKYLPQSLYVGGKTGTYDGATVDPETGAPTTVKIRNHIIVFNANGHEYGLAVLANTGSDESAALLAGGLYRDYAKNRQ